MEKSLGQQAIPEFTKQVISEFSVDMSVDLTLPDADDPEFVDE